MKKRILSIVLVIAMLVTMLPSTLANVEAKTAQKTGTELVTNGTFESGKNGLEGWYDGDGTFAKSASGIAYSGNYSLQVTVQSGKTARLRTDIETAAESTSHTLSFAAQTTVGATAVVTVYEYTHDNRIVAKHDVTLTGPLNTFTSKDVTFETTAKTYKMSVVLTVSGAAGNVFVDNISLVVKENATIYNNPDDLNDDSALGAADLVHIKKAVVNGTKVNVTKFRDQNTDGTFNALDVDVVRKKLVDNYESDLTTVQATSDVIGARLETSNTTLSGNAVAVTEKTGTVDLTSVTENASAWHRGYFYTDGYYSQEKFEYTVDIKDGDPLGMFLGGRITAPAASQYISEGVVVQISPNFYSIYVGNYPNGAVETENYYPATGASLDAGTYTFGLQLTTFASFTRIIFSVVRNGVEVFATAYDYSGTASIPAEGSFVVWNTDESKYGLYPRTISYEVGDEVLETAKNDTFLSVGVHKDRGAVVLHSPNFASGWNRSYMYTEESYDDESFSFTTYVDSEFGEGAKQTGMILGARGETVDHNPWSAEANGIQIKFYNNWYEILANTVSVESENYHHTGFTLDEGTYTFTVDIDTVPEGTLIRITVKRGAKVIHTNSVITTEPVDSEGQFILWNSGEGDESQIAANPYPRAVSYQIGEAYEGGVVSDSSAYTLVENEYDIEEFAFSTEVNYPAQANASADLALGARITGNMANSYDKTKGIQVSFHTSGGDGNYIQIYVNGAWYGASILNLTSGKTYDFTVRVSNGDKKTFVLTVMDNGSVFKTISKEIDAEKSATIADAGSFAIWSTDECKDVLYTMPAKIESSVVVDKNGSAGTVKIAKPEKVDTSNQAYLALEGPYTYEKFEITTTVTDEATPFLVLGARMNGISENPNKYQGATIALYSNFYEVYAPTYGTPKGAENYHTSQAALTVGEEYTFTLQVIGDYLYFETLQDGTLLHSKAFDLSGILPEKGSFMVWSRDTVRTISYKMPYLVTQSSDIKVPEGAESDTVTLTEPTSNYATLAVLGDYTNEYFEFTTTITDPTVSGGHLVIGAGVDGGYGNIPKTSNTGVMFHFYDTFYQIEQPYQTNLKAKSIALTAGEQYTFGIKVETLDNSTVFTLVVTQNGSLVHTYTYTHDSAIDVKGNFVVWTKNYGEVAYEMPKDLLVGSDVVVSTDETIQEAKLVSTNDPKEGSANTLTLDGDYTTEQFEFTTCPGTNQTGAGNMNIGLRFDGATKSPYAGTGIIVRIYSNFYQVYQVTGGSYSHIKDKNYNTSGLVLDMSKEVTFNVRIDDVNKLLYITVTQGNNTGTSSVDISAATSTSGDFVLWRFNNNADITYKMPTFVTEQNPAALYATSTLGFDMYAHIGPSNGVYTDENGVFHTDGTNYRNVTTLQEYKDAGFNAYLMHGSDAVNSAAMGDSAHWFPEFMEQCETVGLDVIVFDSVIHDLAASETSLVGDGAAYATQADLQAAIQTALSQYWDYPAFKGISLVDEPTYKQFTATAQVINAINAIKAETGRDIYIHTVLLPFNGTKNTMYEKYTGKAYGITNIGSLWADMKEAYGTYVDAYLTNVADPYFSVDIYPNVVSNGNNTVMSEYFYNLQYVVQQANAKDKDVHLTIQSTGNDDGLKDPTEADIRFQLNSALGFGVKDIRYYTYWMFPNYTLGYNTAIMNSDGTKNIYDEVQAANIDAQKMAQVMLNFDYVKSAAKGSSDAISNLTTSTLDNVTITSASQPTVVNQLADTTNGYTGYMVLNASVPSAGNVDAVTLTISNYNYATYYVNGVAKTVKLTDGKLSLDIAAGDGVFVIPHN